MMDAFDVIFGRIDVEGVSNIAFEVFFLEFKSIQLYLF